MYRSRFRFQDGHKPPGSGAHPLRREYSYQINARGGSAAVELRMEPANPADPPPQTETLQLRAESVERTQRLRIPLLLGYSVGHGAWAVAVRAGIMADIFLKSDLQITRFVLENSRLRLAPHDKPNVQWTPTRTVSAGYWLSLGGAYRFNRRLTLSAEPVLTNYFSHQDISGLPLPNPLVVGGQVGLIYSW